MIDLNEELVESTLEKTAATGPASPGFEECRCSDQPTWRLLVLCPTSLTSSRKAWKTMAIAGDYETHYNLGIAFKEMGLMEEAIGEFQKALKTVGSDVASEEFVKML